MRLVVSVLVLVGLILGTFYFNPALAERFYFNSEDDIVDDAASLFKDDEIEYISSYHAMLLDKFDLDYRVITLNGQHDINLYAAKIFNKLNIGERSSNHRGLLLIVDAENDQVRLEVSANLESVYTDSFVSYLENRQMIPFFKVNRVADGIFATSEIIRIRAMDAEKGEEFDLAKIMGSLGGGARVKADIDAGKDTRFQVGKSDVIAADEPQQTLSRYVDALKNRNGRTDLDIFTPESRKFMNAIVLTPAQMDNGVKRFKRCEVEHVTYNNNRSRAVLFHSLKYRECDPFLFEKGDDGKWRLDLKALGLGTNHTFGNIWYIHYDRYEESEIWKYNFGFRHIYFHRPKGENGRFDHQGIPYYHRYGVDLNHVSGDILVTDVQAGSFMEKAGIQLGDRIIEWEGSRFLHTSELTRRLDRVRPDLDIRIVLRRDEALIIKTVQAPPYPKKNQYRFGFSYQGYPPMIEGEYVGLPMVHYVESNSQADTLGLKEGDVILKWEDKTSARDIKKWMREVKRGQTFYVEVYREGKVVKLTSITQPLREMSKVH